MAFTATALVIVVPRPSIDWGHDGQIHVANMLLLEGAVRAGDVLPQWADDLNGGLGGPNPAYYSWLAYYVPCAVRELWGTTPRDGLWYGFVVVFVLGLAGAAFCGWILLGPEAALPAALLYSLSPYRLVLVYTRAAFPEYLAGSIAPWVIGALWLWSEKTEERPRLLALAAMASGLMLAVHNLSALLWLPFLCVFTGFCAWRSGHRRLRVVTTTVGFGLISIGVSTFQFFPGLLELQWIHARRGVYELEVFLAWALPWNSFVAWPAAGALSEKFGPGVLQLSLAALGVWIAVSRRKTQGVAPTMVFFVWCIVALVFCSTLIRPIVELAPQLGYLQFPWRYLGPAALPLAMLGASATPGSRVARTAFSVALIFVLFWQSAALVDPVNAKYPVITLKHFDRQVFTGDFEDKYVPVGCRLPAKAVTQPVVSLGPETEILTVSESWCRIDARVRNVAPVAEDIRINRFSFPGWRALLDGQPTEWQRDPYLGAMRVSVPPGVHEVSISIHRPPLRFAYLATSGVFLALLLLSSRSRARRVTAAGAAAVLVGVVCIGAISSEGFVPTREWLESETAQMPRSPSAANDEGWRVLSFNEPNFEGERSIGVAPIFNTSPKGWPWRGSAIWGGRLKKPARDIRWAVEARGHGAIWTDETEAIVVQESKWTRLDLGSRTEVALRVAALNPRMTARVIFLRGEADESSAWQLVPRDWVRPLENLSVRELIPETPAWLTPDSSQ